MYSARELLQGDLLKGEEILWFGQPELSVRFSGSDIVMIPFTLLWGGFAILWEIVALAMAIGTVDENAGLAFVMPVCGLPFVLVGLYLIFGRFRYKKWRKKNTYYAVTNRRVLILTKLLSRNLQAAFVDLVPSISKSVRSDGTGTVRFGNPSFWASMYANTGLDFFGWFYGSDPPTFHDIRDADRVHDLVSSLRNR